MPSKHVCFRVERIRPLHDYSTQYIQTGPELSPGEQDVALSWLTRHAWHILVAGVQDHGDYNVVIQAIIDPLTTQEFLAVVRVPDGVAWRTRDLYPVEVGA